MKKGTFTLTPMIAIPVLYICGIGGCGTLAGNPEDKPTPQAATSITFSLTDAPIDDVKSVFITVESLEVSMSGEGWIDIPLTAAAEIDLLQLQKGKVTPLAALATLPVGTYNQTRLKLSSAYPPRLIARDGVEHGLQVPSGNETGIKITSPFAVEANSPLNLTIDFDLRKSIKLTGSSNGPGSSRQRYMLKPVLRLVRNDATGSITGKAADNATVCLYVADTDKDMANDCDKAENSAVVEGGEFRLAFVPTGSYDLRIFLKDGVTSDVAKVVVKAGETTDLGTVP